MKIYILCDRTIPQDSLQAEGLILLCRRFNWTEIAIVYVSDVYGTELSLELQELAHTYDIEATSIAVSYEGDESYTDAAKQIQGLGIYIIIEEGILGYHYYYLGCDAWLSTNVLIDWNVAYTDDAKGFIGTVPWQTDSLNLSFYHNEEIRNVLSQSMEIEQNILESWADHYNIHIIYICCN